MAHCCCWLSRNTRKITVFLSSNYGTRRLLQPPVQRCISTSYLRTQTDGKDGHTAKHQQKFQNQQSEGYTSDGSSSSSSDGFVEEDSQHEHDIKQRILKASLIHVHEFGWTKKALEAGAVSEGLPPIAQGMFPRGGAELVHYFYAKSNQELAEILKQRVELRETEGTQKPTGKTFIRDAVETRLRMIVPYLDTWAQAMSIQALPVNAVESWTNLLNLSDEIWYYAGDRSVDFNWYTKRVALAGVYKSSEIYMLQDKSVDLQDTWNFMDRRLQDFQSFGANKKKLEQNCDVLKEGFEASFILARNILGMNSRNR